MGLTEQSFGSKRFHKAVLSRESLLWAKGEAVCVWGCVGVRSKNNIRILRWDFRGDIYFDVIVNSLTL